MDVALSAAPAAMTINAVGLLAQGPLPTCTCLGLLGAAQKTYRILGYFYPQNMLVILGRFDLVVFFTEGAAGGGEALW